VRHPEDPCRDPASEARDDWEQLCQPLTDEERRENARKIEALSVPDRFALMFGHASEPRATPETDSLGYIPTDLAPAWPLVQHARHLERQRDEAREHAANAESSLKMAINSANARQTETEHAMRQRDELLEMLESFLGRARMGEVNKGMFVRIEELEGLSAAIAAVKGVTP
jgi:hypothetical protein